MTARGARPVPPSASPVFPYWRFAIYYFIYFAGLGSFLPYWGLYLQSLQFSPAEIGQVLGLMAATKIVAPSVWGWMADRRGKGVGWVRVAGFGAAGSFLGVAAATDLSPLLWMTGLFSLFWNACLPLFEALTLQHLGTDVHRYSRVRLWGSVGFIAAVAGLGAALDAVLAVTCLPWVLWALLLALCLSSLTIPHVDGKSDVSAERFWPIVRRGEVIAFFIVMMLVQVSHGPYYAFFSIHLESLGYRAEVIGVLWTLGVIAEIVLFLFARRLFGRFTVRTILLVSLFMAALRWALLASGESALPMLLAVQALHAASFGAVHAVGVQLTLRYFGGPHRTKGQGLYSSMSFGLGGAIGAWAAGATWLPLGPDGVFLWASACCLLAAAVGWIWVDRSGGGVLARHGAPLR